MEDRSVKLGLLLFFVAVLLIGVPTTMPFSEMNTVVSENTGMYELERKNTTNTSAPTKIVAYRDLDPDTKRFVARAIEQNKTREPVRNISVGEEGLPLAERNSPAVVGVHYNGSYYEFHARLTASGTQTDIFQSYEGFISILSYMGLLIAVIGFVYYTEFGGPHSVVPAVVLGGLGLGLWVLVYIIPFQDITVQSVDIVSKIVLAGGGLFIGVSAWRYLNETVLRSPLGEDAKTRR